jgi:hypothetical protein
MRRTSKKRYDFPKIQKLLPVETESDIEDQYRSRSGKVEHEYNMRLTFGSGIEETAVDKRLSKVLRDNQDRPIKDGDKLPAFDTVGGVGSVQNTHPLGASPQAWYASWWASGMKLHSVWDALTHITGVRGLKDGTDKLEDSGINVDGWEPGRTKDQIMRDERAGTAMPAGFWRADLSAAGEPDTAIHHPCGSPLRRRPCPATVAASNHSDPSRQLALQGVVPRGELWADPMPSDRLLADYRLRILAALPPPSTANATNATAA